MNIDVVYDRSNCVPRRSPYTETLELSPNEWYRVQITTAGGSRYAFGLLSNYQEVYISKDACPFCEQLSIGDVVAARLEPNSIGSTEWKALEVREGEGGKYDSHD